MADKQAKERHQTGPAGLAEEAAQSLVLEPNREGASRYQKVSYPLRYGRFMRLKTPSHCFDFNRNGEIKYIQGRRRDWPHPSEWLKRTMGNQWVYYSAGGYADTFDCFGEYYLPCLPYPSNALWQRDPFAEQAVKEALEAWKGLLRLLQGAQAFGTPEERRAAAVISAQTPERLRRKAERLFTLLGGQVSVLPPDARHVDYDCIPVMLADGCLYNCRFCCVKSGQAFAQRSRRNILEQLQGLRRLLGPDRTNSCTLFLGQHDALNCHPDRIELAAEQGYELLDLERSSMRDHTLLLFGSVGSLLRAPEALWSRLEAMPFRTYVNVGLESADQATLDRLGKPVSAEAVREAFWRMLEITSRSARIELTANFVLDPGLPRGHFESLAELTAGGPGRPPPTGTVYLSPLSRREPREQVRLFKELKRRSRLPMYLYLLQRL